MGRKKKGFVIGCGSALLAFVVLRVLAVVLVVNLAGKEGDKIMLDPKVYESVKVGDSETVVRDKLPHGKSFLGPALKDAAPAEPRGRAARRISPRRTGRPRVGTCQPSASVSRTAD